MRYMSSRPYGRCDVPIKDQGICEVLKMMMMMMMDIIVVEIKMVVMEQGADQ